MKKAVISSAFVIFFVAYAGYQYFASAQSAAYIAPGTAVATQTTSGNSSSGNSTPPPSSAPIAVASSRSSRPGGSQTQPFPTPTPVATKPKGLYTDGSYTGSVEDAYYGYVQVAVTVSGGKIADVQFLQYPNDRSTSRMINSQAMPMLISQAISAQSAQVDGVSGATDTSMAFQQSLASALSQARS